MRRKVVSVMLAAAMCASMTACGGGSSAPAESKAETQAPAAEGGEAQAPAEGEEAKQGGNTGAAVRVRVVYTGNLGYKSYNDS